MESFYKKLARFINTEFDLVLSEPSIFDSKKMMSSIYEWALRFPGNGFENLFTEGELISLMSSKQKKSIFSK